MGHPSLARRESVRPGARAKKAVSGVRLYLHLGTGDTTPRTSSGPGPCPAAHCPPEGADSEAIWNRNGLTSHSSFRVADSEVFATSTPPPQTCSSSRGVRVRRTPTSPSGSPSPAPASPPPSGPRLHPGFRSEPQFPQGSRCSARTTPLIRSAWSLTRGVAPPLRPSFRPQGAERQRLV